MKRLTAILLLIVFTYSFLGAGFVYNIWLYSIKKEVKQKLEKELVEESAIIKVPAKWEENPPDQFQWYEEHEFRYRGQMYDIIRKERHGDQIWYYCHWDKAETELLNNLSEYVASHLQQNPDKQQKKAFLKTFLDKSFLAGSIEWDINHLSKKFAYLPYQKSYTNIHPEIDPPPPRPIMSC